MWRLLGSLTATALFVASPALAANHFIAEFESGLAMPVGVDAETIGGESFGGTLGIGGRFVGHAPAYYLIGRVGHSVHGLYGPERSGHARLLRGQNEYGFGGRVYLPLAGERLRAQLDLAFGQVFEESSVEREGFRTLTLDAEREAFFFGAGLQYRLSNHISVGSSADLAWLPETGHADLAQIAAGIPSGDDALLRLRFALVTAFHF